MHVITEIMGRTANVTAKSRREERIFNDQRDNKFHMILAQKPTQVPTTTSTLQNPGQKTKLHVG